MNIPKITAIDSNRNLIQPYTDMIRELNTYSCSQITFINRNALIVDMARIQYHTVICSPPYYNKEIYGHMPSPYETKQEWNEWFYKPLFKKVWKHLEINGRMVINVSKEIYDKCLVPLFGEPTDKILLPKYNRNNKYEEFIYVWVKR